MKDKKEVCPHCKDKGYLDLWCRCCEGSGKDKEMGSFCQCCDGKGTTREPCICGKNY